MAGCITAASAFVCIAVCWHETALRATCFFAGPTETARKILIFQKVNPLNIYREVTFRLQCVDKFVIINLMRNTRPISWLKAARKNFEEFPEDVQSDMLDALTIAAVGRKSGKAKPFRGIDGGVFEIALRYRGDAFRTLYAVKIGADI